MRVGTEAEAIFVKNQTSTAGLALLAFGTLFSILGFLFVGVPMVIVGAILIVVRAATG